jgi:NAD+ synthase (glutamine-hydrolysing)
VYANAGYGESTTDLVFAGGGIIAENGIILNEGGRFATDDQLLISEIDISNLDSDRRTNTGFMQGAHLTGRGLTGRDPIRHIPFTLPNNPEAELTRTIDPHPFIPSNNKTLRERERKEILDIQVAGLSRRIEHIHARTVVIGVSGGLDSTLALMVAVMTFDALGRARDGILAITMPGFGTSRRTYDNAVSLAGSLGVTLRSISIGKACQQHFEDIGHDPSVHDTTYENIQARERTQILMDIANREGGLVIGTGDLSELALGWATFNGDHMSMYGLNAGIPKTLVRHLVEWIANNKVDKASRATLLDITLTPISPELIPDTSDTDTTNTKSPAGAITQKTEDLVGPYELHDFFLYHFLRYGSTPAKIAFLAGIAFRDRYEASVIDHWLHVFLGRFFAQQYKRNCLPDGPKVGSVSLSPRGDWRMSSDISPTPWLDPVE